MSKIILLSGAVSSANIKELFRLEDFGLTVYTESIDIDFMGMQLTGAIIDVEA